MDDKRTTARWVLLSGGTAFCVLLAASVFTIFAAPIAMMALIGAVIAGGILMRRWIVVAASGAAAATLLASATVWWITWGEAFNYSDLYQPVPPPVQALLLASEILGVVAMLALLAVWVWLLIVRPRALHYSVHGQPETA